MRNVIMAFLFALTGSIANAQSFQLDKPTVLDNPTVLDKPTVCDKPEKVFDSLGNKHKEKPVWTGKDAQNDSGYALFLNEKTGLWTIVQFNKSMACVLGIGKESLMYVGKPI